MVAFAAASLFVLPPADDSLGKAACEAFERVAIANLDGGLQITLKDLGDVTRGKLHHADLV